MRVIDVDSHFMEPFTWFEDAFPEIHAKCPPVPLVEMVVEALMGDLVTSLPPGVSLGPRDLLPKTLLGSAVTGLVLLFLVVLRGRLRTLPHDPYTKVQR